MRSTGPSGRGGIAWALPPAWRRAKLPGVGTRMAEQPVDTTSLFAQVIQDHLELKRRNAALEHEMPLERYMTDDPFVNHPLFKTEEQARVEDTMDGGLSI